MPRRSSIVIMLAAACALAAPASALAATKDFSGPAFNILAPGEYGTVPETENSTDQGKLYDALTPLRGDVSSGDLKRFFLSEKFGVQGPVVRREHTPRGSALKILRDRHDIAHVYGKHRGDVMYGSGWVAAEDRGLLLSLGIGAAYVSLMSVPGIDAFGLVTSAQTFVPSAQAKAFVHKQQGLLRRHGPKGRQTLRDLRNWVEGANAYNASQGNITHWTVDDAIAGFGFVGSIFGAGGGGEAANSNFLAQLEGKLGARGGLDVFNDLRQVNDPAAPVTTSNPAPYNLVPKGPTPGSPLIDPGSLQDIPSVSSEPAAAATSSSRGQQPRHMSNFLVVGAKRSASGHPLAVMGPQLGYFYPEIVMTMELHGGGIDAMGAVPPVTPYVLIGRGRDFAWSLTSANNDNVDQFLEKLCEPDGSAPTRASRHYMYKGRCRAMRHFDAGTLQGKPVSFWQTVHGPVGATATIDGRPYAISNARTTRGREGLSELALNDLNSNRVHSPRQFIKAASQFGMTFNWPYIDHEHIAYFSSGRLPIRARGVNPSLPTLGTGKFDWRGFLPARDHPQAIGSRSGLMLNWNGKPAPKWGAADNQYSYGSIQRVQLFKGFGHKMKLHDVASVMNRAATQDLRTKLLWPTIRKVLDRPGPAPSALARAAAKQIDDWRASGSDRLDRNLDGKIDAPGAAVMDAAWDGIANAVLSPVLGDLTDAFASINGRNNGANSGGSSFGGGWYGYVNTDLRTQLGEKVKGAFSRRYCGNGDLDRCRASLWAAIQSAADGLAAQQGPDPSAWRADATSERIRFAPGLIDYTMRWTNRPTFQQAITFTGHRSTRHKRHQHKRHQHKRHQHKRHQHKRHHGQPHFTG